MDNELASQAELGAELLLLNGVICERLGKGSGEHFFDVLGKG